MDVFGMLMDVFGTLMDVFGSLMDAFGSLMDVFGSSRKPKGRGAVLYPKCMMQGLDFRASGWSR